MAVKATPPHNFLAQENRRTSFLAPAGPAVHPYGVNRAVRQQPSFNDFAATVNDTPSRPIFKRVDIALTNAGSLTLQLGGNLFWYMSSTNASDLVSVQYNRDCDLLPFHPGNYLAGPGYAANELTISWGAQAGASAVIIVGTLNDTEALKIS